MQTDLPHTLYARIGKNGKETVIVDKNDRAFELQREANKRRRERLEAKERGDAPYTIDELFKK